MSWTQDKALKRIEEMMATVSATAIEVQEFSRYYADREHFLAEERRRGLTPTEPIWYVPRNRAVTTHGVHVYANLMDYNDRLVENGHETEASHAQALQLLHLHYSGCDQLIAAFGIQRVDFHGSRLHAVVLMPAGAEHERSRIERAVAFAAAFRRMVERSAARFGAGFRTRVRIGIDSGPAVAVSSGKRTESEPLFIGSPANYAAKLAEGDEAGVFLSPRVVRARRSASSTGTFDVERLDAIDEASVLAGRFFAGGAELSSKAQLEQAFDALVTERDSLTKSVQASAEAVFRFHYKQPPLKTIDFLEHPPSDAIRMPMASVFADIDGFTAYVDQSIASGTVAQAVANLHVMRGEMAAVMRDDFGGRKVRFVGDCLHAIIAEGDARKTDEAKTIRSAVLAASGIRSSFDLCRTRLPGAAGLGIAIGIELGPTPLCRLGLHGPQNSVRCSSSRATCLSEIEQRRCGGAETALGETAYGEGGPLIQHVFRADRKVPNLTYANALALLGGDRSVAPRPHQKSEPMRAHWR
jgi:class 3 adenylate cyclase